MKDKSQGLFISIALILLAVSLRIIPHPANFAPVSAIAIFGGAKLPRKLALSVPLFAMVISDLIIGLHNLVLVTWGCYMLIALASHLWLKKVTIVRTTITAIAASLFFFIVTNFAVWLWSGMYAHTAQGFIRCFTLALPFFRNTLLSDVTYTLGLFGVYSFASKHSLHLDNKVVTQKP